MPLDLLLDRQRQNFPNEPHECRRTQIRLRPQIRDRATFAAGLIERLKDRLSEGSGNLVWRALLTAATALSRLRPAHWLDPTTPSFTAKNRSRGDNGVTTLVQTGLPLVPEIVSAAAESGDHGDSMSNDKGGDHGDSIASRVLFSAVAYRLT